MSIYHAARRSKDSDLSNCDWEVLLEVRNAKTTYDVFRALKLMTKTLSYDKFVVMRLQSEHTTTLSDLAIITNLDPEFIRAYDSEQLLVNNPVIGQLLKSSLPVSWKVDELQSQRGGEKDDIAKSLFADFGLMNGTYVTVCDCKSRRGALGLAGNRDAPSDDELMRLSYFANLVFESLMRFENDGANTKSILTEREHECVYWTAAGKTSGEVAVILEISENTVNHYMSSAALKLGAVNKAHTVAKALKLNILD